MASWDKKNIWLYLKRTNVYEILNVRIFHYDLKVPNNVAISWCNSAHVSLLHGFVA